MRTGPPEAEDQGHNAEVISKKKILAPKFRKFSRKLKRSPGKKMSSNFFSQVLCRSLRRNKIGDDLGLFLLSQKIVMSLSRGQGNF